MEKGGSIMKNKKILTCATIALVASMIAGCSTNNSTTTNKQEVAKTVAASEDKKDEADSTGKEELVFVNFRDIRDLNPHLYAGEMYAQEMLYETLVTITEDGYKGCLAESWDISEDGRVYTFKIREGVYFSDGTICDANAIKANFDAIIENKERHTWL